MCIRDSRNTEAVLDRYHFPEGYDYEFTGTMDSIVETFTSLLVVLIVAILLVYMIMAAQFESFIHPFIIMFSLPLALTGGIMGLFVTGNTITATSFMGFITVSYTHLDVYKRQTMNSMDHLVECLGELDTELFIRLSGQIAQACQERHLPR